MYFGDALHQWLNSTHRITFLSPLAQNKVVILSEVHVCGNMCSLYSVDAAGTEVISLELISASGLLAVLMHHCVSKISFNSFTAGYSFNFTLTQMLAS